MRRAGVTRIGVAHGCPGSTDRSSMRRPKYPRYFFDRKWVVQSTLIGDHHRGVDPRTACLSGHRLRILPSGDSGDADGRPGWLPLQFQHARKQRASLACVQILSGRDELGSLPELPHVFGV